MPSVIVLNRLYNKKKYFHFLFKFGTLLELLATLYTAFVNMLLVVLYS